jgi:F-type H+-transporting ATPase subunit b
MVLFALAEASIQLVPDGTIFLHIGMILLMIWILNRTFFRPINRILEERERKSGRGGGAAGQILSQVDEKVSTYEKALREARSEGYNLMEANRGEANAVRQAQINAVKEEVTGLIATEKDSVRKQTEDARTALTGDARKMAESITSTILKNT